MVEDASMGDCIAFLYYEWDLHGGAVGSPLSNDLYPDWNPKSVADAIVESFTYVKGNLCLVRFWYFG